MGFASLGLQEPVRQDAACGLAQNPMPGGWLRDGGGGR
jgi:hypothetical protein